MRKRLVFLASLLGLCWLGMQAVHESGHILAAYATGGAVTGVDLHPLHISQTQVRPNPSPRLVIWAGPFLGSLFPLLAWGVTRLARLSGQKGLQFFAGFCLIANGVYLGTGLFDPVGDAFDLIQLG